MTNTLKHQIDLKQISSHSYTISHHADWTIGPVLHGGSIAAAIHLAASTHFNTTLAAQKQPDVFTIHFEFLRACERCENSISVDDLKVGAGTSTIQLHLSQNGQIKVIALATSINFEKSVGPTASTAWSLHPAPKPAPDFDAVLAHRPDGNWLPAHVAGDLLPLTRRQLVLNPRDGFPINIYDAWNTFLGQERMDATYLALMSDCIPSMSDTLLQNCGPYDAQSNFRKLEQWAISNPGVPAELTNTFEDAMEATIFNNTVTLDIEFKRRLPEDGVKWTFTRAATRMLEGGRMDLDVTICDEKMELLCLARHVILVLDAKKKFRVGKAKSTL
ncbi:thioesterase family protein [Daldinia decipiens]|uniref:thioesterase family protein n=1 Tax=Daldinia decipiens TaxID=326647 RepID=UPI0020C4F338|nr:thioesterase family protein [Daldinia decipiens]KAI1659964.1 thioesterase family protein [Daldinia decipiens]